MEARTEKRMVCRHGADNSIQLVIERTDTGYTVKATQAICKQCLAELGVDLTENNRAVVMERADFPLSRGLAGGATWGSFSPCIFPE